MDPQMLVDWREYMQAIVKGETAVILTELHCLDEARKAQHIENGRRLMDIERRLVALEAHQRSTELTLGQHKGRDAVVIGFVTSVVAFIVASAVYVVKEIFASR